MTMPKKKPPEMTDLDSLAEAVIRNRNVTEMAEESGDDFTIYKVADVRRVLDALAEAQSNYQFMVNKACDEKLPAYREQGEKLLQAVIRAEQAEAERDRLAAALESQARSTAYFNGHSDGDRPSYGHPGQPIWRDYLTPEARAALVDATEQPKEQ